MFGLFPQSDSTWSEKLIYSLTGVNGEAYPTGGLLLDSHGNLYAAAFDVFRLIPGSNGKYTHQLLHSFTGPGDGAFPESAPIIDKAGNLYGTTYTGGVHYGSVYELIPGPDGNWQERVLHRFSGNGGDGSFPTIGSLVIDADGNLYGMTQFGGSSNAGIVFEITP